MGEKKLAVTLAGDDRRSIGRSNEIASKVLRQPRQFAELIGLLWSNDAIVKMRAADAVEKISLQKPEWLGPYKHALLRALEEAEQPELRWHLALMIPRLPLAKSELKRTVESLQRYLNDRSSIVKTCALQGLADLSKLHPALRQSVRHLLQKSS